MAGIVASLEDVARRPVDFLKANPGYAIGGGLAAATILYLWWKRQMAGAAAQSSTNTQGLDLSTGQPTLADFLRNSSILEPGSYDLSYNAQTGYGWIPDPATTAPPVPASTPCPPLPSPPACNNLTTGVDSNGCPTYTCGPPTPPSPTGTPASITYTVVSGDTLSLIAGRYHETWQQLFTKNQSSIIATAHAHGCDSNEQNCIYPGEVLTV